MWDTDDPTSKILASDGRRDKSLISDLVESDTRGVVCFALIQPEVTNTMGTVSGFSEVQLERRLRKSLYGLKRASREWNIKLTNALNTLVFSRAILVIHYSQKNKMRKL